MRFRLLHRIYAVLNGLLEGCRAAHGSNIRASALPTGAPA